MRMSLRGGRALLCVFAIVSVAAAGAALDGLAAGASAANCPNELLRTGSSAALPDCRGYEMVSPPNKNGGEVDGGASAFGELAAPQQATPDGEAVTYGSTTSFLESQSLSAVVTSQYLSRRTPSGWQTHQLTPAQETPGDALQTDVGAPDFSLFQGFDEGLESGFLLAWSPQPDPAAPEGFYNPYLRDEAGGSYHLLSSVTPPTKRSFHSGGLWQSGTFGVIYAGMSADGRHVIFAANDALTPNAVPGIDNLYQWNEGQPLELVSVLPDGEVFSGGEGAPTYEASLYFGSAPFRFVEGSYSDALSRNGLRAFWTGAGHLYMHEITAAGPRTVEVSASQRGEGGPGSGNYWAANPAGSRVYFTSSEQLTAASTLSAGEDLYEYDVESHTLTDLTVDPHPGQSAEVQGVLGSGETEGSPYVYFVAHGALAAGATEGANNLYALHVGESEPVLIAKLGAGVEAEEDIDTHEVLNRTSRVSPDGLRLAFESERPLTGYDNLPARGACDAPHREGGELALEGGGSEGRCMEVFEYDAATNKLICASCNPKGLPPIASGESIVPYSPHIFQSIYGWQSSTEQQRYLLDDGRLFFDSEDALLPQATNGRQNVYEYEPEGVGQCAASGAGSCLYLISTGTSSEGSAFVDAGESGRDVFFVTRQQLVAQDGDEAIDLYDAREDGGFPEAQLSACAGEACKPALTPAPAIYGAPPSATFQGLGSPVTSSSQPAVVKQARKKTAARKAKKRAKRRRARRKEVRRHRSLRSIARFERSGR